MTPDIEAIVIRLQRLPLSEARRELAQLLTIPRLPDGSFPPAPLHRNALLVSALRDAQVPIWGDLR